ncbi:MAG TPA: hypothetical protein VEI07_25100 [Planctomycetaceae bacterium]|nr:hypothetical protein [Planctomycetaceae bacterium]
MAQQSSNRLIDLRTLATISGAGTGVYLVAAVATRFGFPGDIVSAAVAVFVAIGMYMASPEKLPWYNPLHYVIVLMNACNIFLFAVGVNTVNNFVPGPQFPKPARIAPQKVANASLFPGLDKTPWFPPGDQTVAAERMAWAANDAIRSVTKVRTGITDLSAPIREQIGVLSKNLAGLAVERPALYRQLAAERARAVQGFRDQLARLQRDLESRQQERRRLEESLSRTGNSEERSYLQSKLAEMQSVEKRLEAEIADHPRRAEKTLAELDAEQKKKMAELDEQEKTWKGELAELQSKEKALNELAKTTSPLIKGFEERLTNTENELKAALNDLNAAYIGVRGFSPDHAEEPAKPEE